MLFSHHFPTSSMQYEVNFKQNAADLNLVFLFQDRLPNQGEGAQLSILFTLKVENKWILAFLKGSSVNRNTHRFIQDRMLGLPIPYSMTITV